MGKCKGNEDEGLTIDTWCLRANEKTPLTFQPQNGGPLNLEVVQWKENWKDHSWK